MMSRNFIFFLWIHIFFFCMNFSPRLNSQYLRDWNPFCLCTLFHGRMHHHDDANICLPTPVNKMGNKQNLRFSICKYFFVQYWNSFFGIKFQCRNLEINVKSIFTWRILILKNFYWMEFSFQRIQDKIFFFCLLIVKYF